MRLLEILQWAVDNHPADVSFVPFTPLIRQTKVRRKTVALMGERAVRQPVGEIVANIPVAIARNLQRAHDERDLLVLVHVPRAIADRAQLVDETGLVLPALVTR